MNEEELLTDIKKALLELPVEVLGLLQLDKSVVYVFKLEIEGYMVTGAIHIEHSRDDSFCAASVKFAICSDNDFYKEDLGLDIALGRILRVESPQVAFAGEIPLPELIQTFVDGKIKGLRKVLSGKRAGEDLIESVEHQIYSQISDKFEEYV